EFGFEVGGEFRHVELQGLGVSADKAANIYGRRKASPFARFQGANVVGLDLRDFGDLINVQVLFFARLAQLLRHSGHCCDRTNATAPGLATVSWGPRLV